ncbi:MAG TPA: OmpA family protein [Terrimicrobiaceae bacterium]
MLKRIEGSEILYYKASKFDASSFALEKVQFDSGTGGFKETKVLKAEGPHITIYYKLPAETTTLEGIRQYEAELKSMGYERLFEGAGDDLDDGYNRFVTRTYPDVKGSQPLYYVHDFNHDDKRYALYKSTGSDGVTYVSLYAFAINDYSGIGADSQKLKGVEVGRVLLRVDILREGAMKERMVVVKAKEISSTIEKTGKIAIYGIFFDFDKADIKPQSSEGLAEIAKMLKAAGGKKFLIVGHTDNQGGVDYNSSLSKRRAEAVVKALAQQFDIDSRAIIPIGVGMAAPVAPNTDDSGRAKNRRVEVVAM